MAVESEKKYRLFNRVPDEIREQIVSIYLSGKSSLKIANEIGISKPCVLKILKEFGIDRKKRLEKHTEGIIKEYLSGANASAVARKYNTSNTAIIHLLKKNNIKVRPISFYTKDKHYKWMGGKARKKIRSLERFHERYDSEPIFKIMRICRSRVSSIFKYNKFKKNCKTQQLLGADWATVRDYIASKFINDMSWENHGRKGWHVDHIIPLAAAQTEEELIKLFHYTNLQPLWHEENMKKSSYYDGVHHYRKNRSVL